MVDYFVEFLDIVMLCCEWQVLQFFIECKLGVVFLKQWLFQYVYGGDLDGGLDCGEFVFWLYVSKFNVKFELVGWKIKFYCFDGYWLEKLDVFEVMCLFCYMCMVELECCIEVLEVLVFGIKFNY